MEMSSFLKVWVVLATVRSTTLLLETLGNRGTNPYTSESERWSGDGTAYSMAVQINWTRRSYQENTEVDHQKMDNVERRVRNKRRRKRQEKILENITKLSRDGKRKMGR